MISEFFKSSFSKRSGKPDRDTLKEMLNSGEFNIEDTERDMLLNVLDVKDKIVREIMLPRIDMVTVQSTQSINKIITTILDKGHSRLPLIGENKDTVEGIIYAKDLLKLYKKKLNKIDIKDFIRKPFFVPETKKVLDLLKDFQVKKIHLAIVIDEYGGVSGLVSMEDILEEFVGEIQDEYDNEKESIVKIRKNIYNLDAKIAVDFVNSSCRINLPEDLADTMGGLFMELFGSIPEKNNSVHYKKHKLRVISVDGNRIIRLQLTIGR